VLVVDIWFSTTKASVSGSGSPIWIKPANLKGMKIELAEVVTNHFDFDTFRLAASTALNSDLEVYFYKIGPAGLFRNLSGSYSLLRWLSNNVIELIQINLNASAHAFFVPSFVFVFIFITAGDCDLPCEPAGN